MVVRQKRLDRPLVQNRSHELPDNVTLDQSLAVERTE
jgi:hypothetical protein